MPRSGIKGTSGQRKGRGNIGIDAPHDQHTITNASRVPILTSSASTRSEQGAHQTDLRAGQDRRFPGRAKARMDRAEEARRQESVSRHGEHDPRLAEHLSTIKTEVMPVSAPKEIKACAHGIPTAGSGLLILKSLC